MEDGKFVAATATSGCSVEKVTFFRFDSEKAFAV
jgi:hypothetical protein